MIKVEFIYKSISENEEIMLNNTEKFLDNNRIDGKLKNKYMLCVSEAFTNALIHGNHLNPEKEIIVISTLNQSTLVADIIDEGTGGIEKINKRKQPELLSEGGRGVELIKHYSNSFELSENKQGGLHINIVFELNKEKVNCS